ncbi:TIGR03086 family protein [Actinokineospora alba]|uniref:TIGR03086 family protein n=1 Tax=Actinokineospora alba TaxID=504798 RepID=A0A1H0PYH0_9PSEU|nr:hypothetical protein [Actinokineospora alba]TDP65996.1 uncharacterized protein (TIGR03086 family) [Actinokineospora alba]SDI60524.1 TIGR03086 family protein [Actinokineospora alba]SDP10182.1 TIGR03086 family protein [Actinokineospora alba]
MRKPEVFVQADRGLAAVVARIQDDQWDRELPDTMRWISQLVTLRDLVNHHARDDAWVPDVLAGRTIDEVGDQYDGDLLGADPRAGFARWVEIAVDAVERFHDFDRTVHLSYGDFPASEYLLHVTVFRGMGLYDIAEFIGVEPRVPEETVTALYEVIAPKAQDLREMGVFGPEVEVEPDAPLEDRLLGLTGRNLIR